MLCKADSLAQPAYYGLALKDAAWDSCIELIPIMCPEIWDKRQHNKLSERAIRILLQKLH